MITVQLELQEQTVTDMIAAATSSGLSFNEYVEWRLNVDLDKSAAASLPTGPADPTADQIAHALYLIALDEPSDEGGPTYLVEDLYKRSGMTAWSARDRGNRIMIGKAFKRIVDAQLAGGREVEDGRQMKVITAGRTAQNQAIYQTVRAG